MRKRNIMCVLAASVLAGSLLVGCKKDSETTKKEDEKVDVSKVKNPAFAGKTSLVTIPAAMSNSSDPHAQVCSGYLMSVNAISSYSSLFTVPEYAKVSTDASGFKSSQPLVYSWTNGPQTVYYVYQELDSKNTWGLYYTDQSITKGKVASAEQTKDESSGNFLAYDYKTSKLYGGWYWKKISGGMNVIFKSSNQGSDVDNTYIDLNSLDNGSGSLKFYESSKLIYEASWNTNGTGSYKGYSADSVSYKGTW